MRMRTSVTCRYQKLKTTQVSKRSLDYFDKTCNYSYERVKITERVEITWHYCHLFVHLFVCVGLFLLQPIQMD